MKKKLLSLIMATAMILSLAVPAFATGEAYYADGTKEEQLTPTITFQATTFVPTISLTMPALNDNPVVLNPYKIEVTGENIAVNGLAAAPAANDATKQVISPVYSIKNNTDAKLKFVVSATTTVADTVTLATDYVSLTETKKSAHIMLVVGKSEVSATDFGKAQYNDNGAEQTLNRFDTAKYETILLKKGEAKSGATNMAIAAAAGTEEGQENYLVFQFQGDMSRTPTSSWLNTDTLSTVIKFTFTPDSAQDDVIDLTANTISLGNENAVAAFTSTSGNADIATLANITPTKFDLNTTPAWEVIPGSSAYGAKLDPTTNPTKIVVAKDGLKALKEGTHDDVVILGCKDSNGVPRTIEVKYQLTVTS